MASSRKCCRLKADDILLILMIVGVAVGVGLGVGLRFVKEDYTDREVMYISFLGDIFLRLLKMLILPLIVSSLISALTKLQLKTAGRMAWVTVLYFLITTFLAVVEGIVLVETIKPGNRGGPPPAESDSVACKAIPVDTILDLVRNMFPDNIVQACFQSSKTCITDVLVLHENKTVLQINSTYNATYYDYYNTTEEQVKTISTDGMNILGLVAIAIAFGIVISSLGSDGQPLAAFFSSLEAATMKLVAAVIWYSPIGIVFLIAGQIVKMDDPVKELQSLGLYVVTVIAGLALHGLILLPLIYLIFVRKNPLRHLVGSLQALITALGTDSSSATLPVTIKCMEENCKIDTRIVRFVCPLGATLNMNGSALYEAVASIYISQVVGRTLTIGEILLVSLTATLAAVGAAGIPQAGLVTLLMVLTAVGLPPEYAALIIPVDWFLDRIRTMVNVFGDTVGTAIVQKFCLKYLPSELKFQTTTTNSFDFSAIAASLKQRPTYS